VFYSLFFALVTTPTAHLFAQNVTPTYHIAASQNQSEATKNASLKLTAQAELPAAPAPQTVAQVQNQNQTQPQIQVPLQPGPVTLWRTPQRILLGEKELWTSPARVRLPDMRWLLPLAAGTGVLIGSDAHTMSLMNVNTTDQSLANTLTNGSVGALAAIPASMFLWSAMWPAPLARETSLLTGESLTDAMILDETGKAVFRRNPPTVGDRRGKFFSSSFSLSSFPSNHAAAAWAMASVIGDEYPEWLTHTIVYTLAGTTSVGRIVAEKHFPSDVLVGSAIGWLVGQYVFHTHHHYELTPFSPPPLPRSYSYSGEVSGASSAASSPSVADAQATVAAAHLPPVPIPQRAPLADTEPPDPDRIGSTNVPMDSWVYPALDRLAAMGFLPSQSIAIRPWSRVECARQVAEASEMLAANDTEGNHFSRSEQNEAERLLDALRREFEGEARANEANESIALESVYTRYGNIAGPALADSYHFGQTWWNDFGRPLGRGGSALLGFSAHATEGRMLIYGREEMQHGPGAPAYSSNVEQLIAFMDSNPVQTSVAMPAYTRYRPIELYAGVAFGGNALSLGKQELFWGPTTMGPLAFSSNAEPTYNLRFVATRPHPLPFFPNLGTFRFDIVIGKLSGHQWPARPWYNGQKADFNLGPNLELSFTRWSLLWGVGHPMTLGSLIHNLDSFSSLPGTANYGNPNDPGDRKSNFDFRYRLPWLRRQVTLYADAYSDDDPNPMDAPRRAVWNPGIYFARLPWLTHMDLRVEAVSSERLIQDAGGQEFFYNNQYHDANTNKGFLLGNAIGRDSRAVEGRVGWWVSAQTRVEAGYRQNKGSAGFLPGGGTISDGFVNATVQMSRHWSAQVFEQYERFLIPSYRSGAQTNRSGWL